MDKTAVAFYMRNGYNKRKTQERVPCVMHDGRYQDRTNFTSNDYLHINSCGVNRYLFTGEERNIGVFRPDGRVDIHLLLVTHGTMHAKTNDRLFLLNAGDCMVYLPHTAQHYTMYVSAQEPLYESLWLHFCGTAAEEVMRTARLWRSEPIKPVVPAEAQRVFEAIVRAHRAGDQLTACGNILRLLAQLSPCRAQPESESVRRVRAEAEFIAQHYPEKIDLDACAARCCLSRSRFTHLFTEVHGRSPYRYQQELRLEQARELLAYSSLSVSEIAEQLGFEDALYFSRLFRRGFGVPPSAFRRKG